jgi:hypothetical protein
MNVSDCTDNEHIEEDIELFDKCLREDDEIISERLRVLGRILKDLEII